MSYFDIPFRAGVIDSLPSKYRQNSVGVCTTWRGIWILSLHYSSLFTGKGKLGGQTRCGGKKRGRSFKKNDRRNVYSLEKRDRDALSRDERADSCGRIASLETDVGQGFEKGGREEARKVGPPWTGMEFKWRSNHETGGKIKKFDLILHWTSQ